MSLAIHGRVSQALSRAGDCGQATAIIILIICYWSCPRVKISQLVNKMCSHCLFPVVDKSGTSCYHLVTRLTRPTDSQQVIPTSLISSARNKLITS
jgi:hypothetical protein